MPPPSLVNRRQPLCHRSETQAGTFTSGIAGGTPCLCGAAWRIPMARSLVGQGYVQPAIGAGRGSVPAGIVVPMSRDTRPVVHGGPELWGMTI